MEEQKIKRKYTRKPKSVPVDTPIADIPVAVDDVPVDTAPIPVPEPAVVAVPKKVRKPNPWLEYTKKIKLENPDKTYKEVLSIAKLSYKKK
jgi:hypothetical protein